MRVFLAELEDRITALNENLLRLERGQTGTDRAETIRALFRAAHSLKGAARSVEQHGIERCCQHLETLFAGAQSDDSAVDAASYARLYAAVDAVQALGNALAEGTDTAPATARLDEATAALEGAAPAEEVTGGTAAARRAAEPATPGATTREGVAPLGETVRVAADKLDDLQMLSGELHVAAARGGNHLHELDRLMSLVRDWRNQGAGGFDAARARLDEIYRGLGDLKARFAADNKDLERSVQPMERSLHAIRMQPFRAACDGLDRVVRDLAVERGREVALSIEGGELELDRTLLEELRAPLLQLVRNAVDHGLEPPAARRAAGKPEQGRIVISAAIRNNRARIRFQDDGRGLAVESLARRAALLGLEVPTDQESLASLIFEPGLSTAEQVTDVSGRGVGLDIVKSTVTGLRGGVTVNSVPGRGLQFDLMLPLTLASFRALLTRVGSSRFAVDIDAIHQVVRITDDDIASLGDREALVLGDQQIPVALLAEVLDIPAEEPAVEPDGRCYALLAAVQDERVAIVVDEVLGDLEIVSKPLPEPLRGGRHLVGAAMLPDGDVALILNVHDVMRSALETAPRRSLLDRKADPSMKRVLVVDDSMTTRLLVVSILEATGYRVTAAADGAEAWELLSGDDADLVVSDVEMPHMDGLRLTRMIRNTPRTRHLPVVLVTALETDEEKMAGMEAGADAYLVKSTFDQTELLQAIQRLLP